MSIDQLLQVIFQNGSSVGLAVFSLWMLNKTWEQRIDDRNKNESRLTELLHMTRQALVDNTAALTRLCEQDRFERSGE